MIKYFRFSWQYVLWGISYINLNMLLATIPVYETSEERQKKGQGDENTDLKDVFKDFE